MMKIFVLIICFLLTPAAFGNSDDIDTYFSTLSALNRYSPLDGAGSHGGIGAQVAAGAGFTTISNVNPLIDEQLQYGRVQTSPHDRTIVQPKLYLLKGLYAPVDIGATYSVLETRKISQLMGHIQWTIFEAFQLPALALRLNYGKFMGLYSSDFTSAGLDVVASMGFLRYFTVYADMGLQKNYGSLRVSKDQESAYIFQNPDFDQPYQSTQITRLAGLHVQIMPAFAVAVLEAQDSANGLRTYHFKLGFGI